MAVPAFAGVLVVVVVWLAGPGILGPMPSSGGTVVDATVTAPAPCSDPTAKETVQFQAGGQTRTGSLDACGHDKNNRVRIAVPADLGPGQADVHLADVVVGHTDLRRPVGLALLALSCLSGGAYAFLVQRGSRRAALAG
ncbi:hypothetical protein FG385_22525 [Amycolatopsis alkalitolerans]|uniref:Uncharacterized protein n=1 Tax=Amycolatopsis alkalitolerans TaxID=2547244 RepID=A0A5C4M0T2_9PSEU|nr:hypothetical protein FG385_22525 [Amycolatopsis alkalitolerans]